MSYRRAVVSCALAALLAGCGGGGGGNVPPVSTGSGSTQSTQSQSISPSGGTVSTTLNGQTATVTYPAGAFPSSATVSLTLFATPSTPRAFASVGRAKAAANAVPAGSSPYAAIQLDASVAPQKAGTISVTSGGQAQGFVLRLAGYGTNGFGDVDTVSYKNGSSVEDNNPAYPGASLAAKTLYVFYTVPTANAAPAPTVAVQIAGNATVPITATAQFAAAETDGNGFPFFGGSFTYAVDTPALGTIDPKTGVLTAGPTDASGNVVATDTTRPGLTGKLPVAVSAAVRPAAGGDAFAFAGTLTTTLTANLLPGSTAPVSSTETSAVTQNVSAGGSTDGVNYSLTADESDAAQLRTLTTHTVTNLAFQHGASGYVVRVGKTVSKDSNGVTYETDYGPNNGALTTVPESAGTLANDAQATYLENDPGNPGYDQSGKPTQPTTSRQTNADGSYYQLTWNDGAPGQYLENPDGTGIASVSNGATEYDFGTPVTTANPPYLPIHVYNVAANGTKTPNGPNGGLRQVFPWYGLTVPALSADTVTIAPSAALDASCTAYGGAKSATLVTERLQTLDTVLGQTETRTTKSYDVAGPGTVCVVLSDTIATFYDYSGQEGFSTQKRPTSATPFQTTTVSETLSLTKATTVASATRSAQAVAAPHLPVLAALRARFDHVAANARAEQSRRLGTLLRTTGGTR